MTIAVRFDQPVGGLIPRAQMYGGALNITSPSTTSVAFAMFARELIGEAFGGRDPELAQFDLPAADHAAVLNALKPRFIHHCESTRFVQQLLLDRGCDPETTYFDVPRLRASTSDDYLATGNAQPWHPHRDTWSSAPLAQLNHWMPVYDVTDDNSMAVHTEYFSQAIPNTSASFDYHQWHARDRAEGHPLPGPTETVNPFSANVFVTPVGGMAEFSGHHLHACVPNNSGRTRFSIDFRTVDVSDIRAGLGARNVDGRCTGSSIREFVSAADLTPMPDDVVALLNDRTETSGDVVHVLPTQPAMTRH
jgi:hypothetical protein